MMVQIDKETGRDDEIEPDAISELQLGRRMPHAERRFGIREVEKLIHNRHVLGRGDPCGNQMTCSRLRLDDFELTAGVMNSEFGNIADDRSRAGSNLHQMSGYQSFVPNPSLWRSSLISIQWLFACLLPPTESGQCRLECERLTPVTRHHVNPGASA